MATVNIYDMADTWNAGGTTFSAIKMNVTDTASATLSMLLDLRVGGVSKAGVTKDGSVFGDGFWKSAATSYNGANVHGIHLAGDGFNFYGNGTWMIYTSAAANQFNFKSSIGVGWGAGDPNGTPDAVLRRAAAGILSVRGGGTTAPGAFNFYTYDASPPAAPAASTVVIYMDTSGGKGRVMARFASGAAQQIAVEP